MPPEAAIAEEAEDLIDAPEGDEGQDKDAPQSSAEAVKVASLMGWKDPKKWEGDPPPGGLKTAEEFLADVPEVLRNTRKKSDRLESQVNRIVAQLAKVEKGVDKQADAEARKSARELMEAGDFDGAEKILTESRPKSAAPDEDPAFTAFKERNDWFGVDDDATAYAALLDKRYAANGIADPAAHMRKVEAGVKKAFPELFEKAAGEGYADADKDRGRRAPLVNRGGRTERTRASEGLTVAEMTPSMKKAARDMNVSDKDYVSSYNKWKGV